MAEVQRTYPEQFNERDLFVLELEKPEDFPEQLALSSPRFACLLVWDARESDEVRVGQLARKLLSAGAVYICIWGPDCQRIHEIIGRTQIAAAPAPVGRVAVTSGDAQVPLAEAVWDVLYGSVPDEAFAASCGSTVGITIGLPARAAEVRAAFTDPIGFNARLVHPS
jgi:hypothetical protein